MATAEINALGAQITVRMTRGDTLPLVIGLKNKDGTVRPLEVGDTTIFRVWDKYTKANLITKSPC